MEGLVSGHPRDGRLWEFAQLQIDITLGTRGFSRVRREFSVLAETANRARKVSGTQGK